MTATTPTRARSRTDMLAAMYASDASANGRFVTAVLTTGIYCLPSCRARKPKAENVRFYASEAEARSAGFRPCRRCRPHHFYERYDPDIDLATGVAAAVRRDPGSCAGIADLTRISGVGGSKLNELFRRHFHTTPAAFLADTRLLAARALLAGTRASVAEVAFAVGYASVPPFYQQFRRRTGLTPAQYRRLGERPRFHLRLPADYRRDYPLRMLGRAPDGRTEGARGDAAFKVLGLPGGVAVLRILFNGNGAECAIESARSVSAEDVRAAHAVATRLLGLGQDPAAFERRMADRGEDRLVGRRSGLRVPLTADPWEAIVWAIIGQQVNLPFAMALRGALIELAGKPVSDGLRAHPTPAAVATLDPADLCHRRFSARKADCLVDLARRVVAGELPLDDMDRTPVTESARRLRDIRGIGPWTEQYIMMRGLGFGDCVPVGDSGLATALQRFFALECRPGPAETRSLMARFAPFRSLATYHLWQTLSATELTWVVSTLREK